MIIERTEKPLQFYVPHYHSQEELGPIQPIVFSLILPLRFPVREFNIMVKLMYCLGLEVGKEENGSLES